MCALSKINSNIGQSSLRKLKKYTPALTPTKTSTCATSRRASRSHLIKSRNLTPEISPNEKFPSTSPDKISDISYIDLKTCIPDWLLHRKDFTDLYKKQRGKSPYDIGEICSLISLLRNENQKEAVFTYLSNIMFFKNMPRMVIRETCDKLCTEKVQKGKEFIIKGHEADCMYIIYKGSCGIFLDGIKIGRRKEGDVVGEAGMDVDKVRNADVIAESNLVMLKIRKEDYQNVVMNFKKAENYENMRFLMNLKIFSKWSLQKIQKLSDYLVVSRFGKGDCIYEYGSESMCVYFLFTGSVTLEKTVEITKCNKWPSGKKQWETQKVTSKFTHPLGHLSPGDIFGTETLSETPHSSRAISTSPTTLLILNKNDCLALFSSSDMRRLIQSSLPIPDQKDLQNDLHEYLASKTLRENLLHDALKLNHKDWGGRETDLEKSLRKPNRCLASLKLSLKKSFTYKSFLQTKREI
ncbi:hypothetical protein SteCoe_3088 [Stentor coeruleus]|uniref:Cyclic nucleotide-binding domain-containing protein n=1 Tax=Stentor coeruleus TaxID=5963 RepID=A0A1R2CY52_9CILI|nr:hypothetical protein SteCoe_3088 [Stentor coeruleus]